MIAGVREEGSRQIVWRIVRAPRDAAFRAWVDPEALRCWFGCDADASVRHDVEPRVGGRYDHHVVTSGGGRVDCRSRFVEFDAPRRLAYETEVSPSEDAPEPVPMRVSVDFTDLPGSTGLRIVHSGVPADLDEVVAAGWAAALDRLESLLAVTSCPAPLAR